MNEKGASYIESCLAVAILFTIIGIIVPIQTSLQRTLQFEMLQVHVTEAAMNGALMYKYYQETSGDFRINGQSFYWTYNEGEVCVHYEWDGEVSVRCISA